MSTRCKACNKEVDILGEDFCVECNSLVWEDILDHTDFTDVDTILEKTTNH